MKPVVNGKLYIEKSFYECETAEYVQMLNGFFFCFYFWIRLRGNWTYCKCLQKKGVPLKDCLISEKNNKLTFYDSFQKTRRIGNSISKSSLFMCKTYEFFFCHTKINEPMNWRKRKIGVNRIKSNLSSFYRWTQVSNHWFGKCKSIDKNGCKRTHKANDSANKIRTFRERERETSGNGTKQKENQTAFVQDSFFFGKHSTTSNSKSIAIKKKTNRNWHNHTEYIVKCAKIAWWFWKTT